MSSEEKQEPEKFLKMTFRSNGQIEIESNNVTVFDLWALSNYLKMRADEMYVSMQTQEKMKEAAASRGIQRVAAGMIPDIQSRRQ